MPQAERKEMVTNDLVKGINRAYEGIRKGPSRGTIIAVAVFVAIVAVYFVGRHFWNASDAADSKRWLMLDESVFPEQLTGLLDESDMKDTTQYQIVRFKEARMKLAQGLRELGSGESKVREKARADVSDARKIYEELAKSSSRTPQLHQEAIWGSAKAAEALGGGDNLDDARKLYESLRKEYPNSALGKDAAKQLERLDSASTKKDLQELTRELEGK
jgi:hypothetical protein